MNPIRHGPVRSLDGKTIKSARVGFAGKFYLMLELDDGAQFARIELPDEALKMDFVPRQIPAKK